MRAKFVAALGVTLALALASPTFADDSLADNGKLSCGEASASSFAQCVIEDSAQTGANE
jgi:hypothetical protein